ncbi:hypothetical protein GWO43_15595, partial [candidate division KSB1 bacterium]|nr:hypothetical protein [candidate division KSB1 bacterium]NIR68438.1 hypothetical protein [candidate division KSB1 bacterium]NIS25390.1 hypothetical protein [candidate division KSB1 bacterium]NIT72267.1 hypothetical protein [candidate division KSB1 bacterium]NIU26072.1 hypothetical protein [candidate division KSB1 bacterium]
VQAQKVGKLLGAGRLISGGAERITNTIIQLNAGVVVSQSGKLMGQGVQMEGSISEVVRLTNNLVVELLDNLEVRTTDAEYRQILEPPTNSSLAFIAFSKGLDYEDRNLHAQARYQYNKAIKLDPAFKMARQKLAHLPGDRLTIWEMEKLATTVKSSINGKIMPDLFAVNQI